MSKRSIYLPIGETNTSKNILIIGVLRVRSIMEYSQVHLPTIRESFYFTEIMALRWNLYTHPIHQEKFT